MSNLPKVLVLSFTDHASDPRVHRQVQALQTEPLALYTAGSGSAAQGAETTHTRIVRRSTGRAGQLLRVFWLKTRQFERYYRNMTFVPDARAKLSGQRFDLIIANDLETLPLALELAGESGRVWIDAHEYTPREMEDRWQFRFFFAQYWDYIARVYLPRADHMTTVGQRIAEEYSARYGVDCGLLINAPLFEDQSPSSVEPQSIRLVHHGGVNLARRLDVMVEMMRYVDERFSLDLYLMPNDPDGMAAVQLAAQGLDNVCFREPVPMPTIAGHMNQYDMGLCFIWPNNFNYEYSLPNKLFEFIQARLAVAIWPSPEMRRVVETHGLGPVVESYDPREMAAVLNALSSQQIKAFKDASANAAQVFNAEQTMQAIRTTVKSLWRG